MVGTNVTQKWTEHLRIDKLTPGKQILEISAGNINLDVPVGIITD